MQTPLILLAALTVLIIPARADDARIAALEATVAQLQTQNLALKNAIEAVAGKPLAEILGSAPAPAAAVASQTPAPDLVLGVPVDQAKSRLEQLDDQVTALTQAHEAILAQETAPRDPFGGGGGVKKSAADLKKQAALRLEEIARVQAQAETLRTALAGR